MTPNTSACFFADVTINRTSNLADKKLNRKRKIREQKHADGLSIALTHGLIVFEGS
jgi:hypothetical protein